MAEHQTIIGSYETHQRADAIVEELKQAGFLTSNIEILDGATHASGEEGTLREELRSWGLPEEDAASYVAELMGGRALVALDAEGDEVPKAVRIMRAEEYDEKPAAAATEEELEATVPVIEEEIHIGKRRFETGGVRVVRTTHEEPVSEEVRLHDERIHVERTPTDRPVTSEDVEKLQKGDIVLTESEEHPVVEKSARVVEEVKVGKHVEEHTERVEDTVHREDVEVEHQRGREPPEART